MLFHFLQKKKKLSEAKDTLKREKDNEKKLPALNNQRNLRKQKFRSES